MFSRVRWRAGPSGRRPRRGPGQPRRPPNRPQPRPYIRSREQSTGFGRWLTPFKKPRDCRTQDVDRLLAEVRQRIPEPLIRPGSYAVIRRTTADEVIEQVIPLAGDPITLPERTLKRHALSFGMVNGGRTSNNAALLDRIDEIWQKLLDLPDADADAAVLIVVWVVGGDIYSPAARVEKVRIENRAEVVLRADVLIPHARFGLHEADVFVRESLDSLLLKAERLIKRRKLGWDLDLVRTAAGTVVR